MFVLSACGQPDTGVSTSSTPTMPVTSTVDVGIEVDPAQMIAAAVEHSGVREAIISGEPEVLLATPGTPESIRQLGLNIGNWDPTCARPMFLVILKGEFDGSNLIVARTDEGEMLGQYVAYIFDLSAGVPGSITFTILSEDGGTFKDALGDSSLPDPDTEVPDPAPPYPPCEDTAAPGEPEHLATTAVP